MPRPPRLQKRRHRFYLRAAVPEDVRPIIRKTEVIRSLKTSDYREALRRLPLASAEVDAEFEAARRQSMTNPAASLDNHQIKQLVLLWFHRMEHHAEQAEAMTEGMTGQDEVLAQTEADLGVLSDIDDPRTLAAAQSEANRLLREHDAALQTDSPGYRLLCQLIRRGMIEATKRGRDRLEGDYGGRSHDPTFEGLGADRPGPTPAVRSGVTLTQLVEKYVADPTRDAGDKANGDYQVVLRFLSEFVDPETPVSHVTRDHCRQVAALLKRFPANANKRQTLRGLRPLRAASKAERLGLPPMCPTTANGYISKMSALFRWAAREGLVERNVAEGLLLPETMHRRDARKPFSVQQLN